jgi:hypothetical protein
MTTTHTKRYAAGRKFRQAKGLVASPDMAGPWGLSAATRLRGTVVVAALVVAVLVVAGCGSTTTTTSIVGSGTVTVVVTSPTSGTVIAADNVTVRGTVSPTNAVVQIQGQPAAVGNGVFTGTATLHGGKTTIDVVGSAPGETPGSTSVTLTRQSSGGSSGGSPHHSSSSASGATPGVAYAAPAGSGANQTPCGGGLSVGPDTTCSFAENVRSAYNGSGAGTVQVYSPVTRQTYSMTCSAGTPVVCTGGNNASVYFP